VIVLDASVAVKWFRDEEGSDLAAQVLVEHRRAIVVPDLFTIEVASALVRSANMLKSVRTHMERALATFDTMVRDRLLEPVATHGHVLTDAWRLALDLGHPVKDCLYLALAISRECPLLTADAKFAEKARGAGHDVRLLLSDQR